MARKFGWIEDPEQRIWLWIAVLFALFYFGEAILFWGPEPRIHAPAFTPLVYWGAFGAGIIGLVNRQGKSRVSTKRLQTVPAGLQAVVLGTGVTASVIGITFGVIRYTNDVTLGHCVLLGTMFEAAIVIGGMSGSLGWLAASAVWATSAFLVLCFPAVQDITLGCAVAIGFALVGILRKCLSVRNEDADAPTSGKEV